MKIGIFVDSYVPEINGVVTATETLAKVLKSKGDEVYIITTNPFGKGILFKDNIIRLPGLELKKLYGYRIASIYSHKADKILKRLHFDVIHVQTEASIGIFGRIFAKKYDIPLVYTYHTMYIDYTYYVTKGFLDPIAKSLVKKLSKLLAKISTEFVTTSIKTKNALKSYSINQYINVVPNGIDIEVFNRSHYQESDFINFKKKLGIEDKFIILSLGRVAKEKSLDVCIKEYAEFVRLNNDTKTVYLIVGDGPDKDELEKLSISLGMLGRIIFLGKVLHDEVPFYYNLSDLYLSASTSETQGLTFIEAMASKVLVLCQYDDNLSEVVIDSKTGYYFYSENECHEKLKYVISLSEEKKKEIIENAYENVKKYSIDIFYDSMKEVYHRAIRKRW